MDQLAFFDDQPALPPELLYQKEMFDTEQSEKYLRKFVETVPWQQKSVVMYGKEVLTPRLTAWFGDANAGYSASASRAAPLAWTKELLEIREKVEAASSTKFNTVLLNYYRNGNDSVSWHDDQDGIPGRNRIVGSVSFGQERVFDFRKKDNHAAKYSLLLESGSFLLMRGNFQSDWQHRIAKSNATKPRINLTFRISETIE